MAKIVSSHLWEVLRPQLRRMSTVCVPILPSGTTEQPHQSKKDQIIISCKRKEFNFFSHQYYGNLDDIPLASKGWKHAKSKGDYFTIHPVVDEYDMELFNIEDLNIDNRIIDALKKIGIQKLSDFQRRSLEKFNKGNLMLAAETGCGKTFAYLIPIVQHLLDQKTNELNTPSAVILVPNRELAVQVGEMAEQLVGNNLNVKVIIGGRTKRQMTNPEFNEIDILVATPGVLGKLSTVGLYKLNKVLYTVLDEADTLVDDSFEERITSLVKRLQQSQIILVSATLPRKLPPILETIQNDLIHVTSPKLHRPLLNIKQKFLRIEKSVKPSYILEIAKANKRPLLIFTNRNETCNWLAQFLRENNLSCSNINGNMNYAIRIEQWNNFVKGKAKILAATDVGSRGLNTTQIRQVVNYDFPLYAADYLHRIGRIGRLGSHSHCKATNFISGPEEVELVQQIELAIRKRQALSNVDGNITNIVQRKIQRGMRQNIK